MPMCFQGIRPCVALAGVVLSVQTLFAADLNPIARWSFEDADDLGSNAVSDVKLEACIATASYATPASASGIYGGKGVNLRRNWNPVGNAMLSPANCGLPTGSSPFTVTAWIRPYADQSSTAYVMCFMPLTSGVPGAWDTKVHRWSGWYLRFNENRLLLCFGGWRSPPSTSDATDVVGEMPSGSTYNDGLWHHVAFSRDAQNLVRIYWDGNLIAEHTVAYSVHADSRLLIGSYETGNYYNGDYDEVCVFDRVLTLGEVVSECYRGNPDGITPDADGRVVLDAPAGTVVTNEVAYAYGSSLVKTGEGGVLLCQASGSFHGTVGVTNGHLRTGEVNALKAAAGYRVEKGATFEFGRSLTTATPFYGEGTFKLSGSGTFDLTGDLSAFVGTWSTYLATVNFGTSSAPLLPNPAAALAVDGGGFVNLYGDAEVAALSGEGLVGGVAVPDGATLTVAGATDTAFAGQLAGKGTLVKNGAGRLALSGASAFTNVTVNAGGIVLDRAASERGRGFWRFDDADDLGHDSGVSGNVPLTVLEASGETPVAAQVDGLVGKAVRVGVKTDLKAAAFLASDATADLPKGTSPYTFSAWLRPQPGSSQTPYVVRMMPLTGTPGNWTWTGWGSGWYLLFYSGGQKIAVSYCNGWDATGGTADAKAEGDLPAGDYADGEWHHVAITLDTAHALRVYWDGRLVAENTALSRYSVNGGARLQLGSYEMRTSHGFNGDFDEVQYLDGAWTAGRVAEEYAARRATCAVCLPTPLAHWTFDAYEEDEHGRFFRDSGTAGWHFYEKTAGTVSCIGPSDDCGAGVNGGAAYRASNASGAYLKVGDYVSPKATFSDTNPDFTFSMRFRNCNVSSYGRAVLTTFGSAQTAGECLRITHESLTEKDGEPRVYRVIPGNVNNGDGAIVDDTFASCGAATPWVTLTVVSDGATRTSALYRDGRYVGTCKSNYALNLDRILIFAGYNYAAYGGYAVDDLCVFDWKLTDAQVKQLVREQAGATSAPLANAAVTLANGTTLTATNGTHVAASVRGTGDVAIGAGATFGARDLADFAGRVSGEGHLAVYSKLPTGVDVSSQVLVAGAVTDMAGAGVPVVTSAGRVKIASTGVVRVTDVAKAIDLAGRRYVLARAAEFETPSDFSGWTLEPSAADFPYVFSVRGGEFVLRVKGGGNAVILR